MGPVYGKGMGALCSEFGYYSTAPTICVTTNWPDEPEVWSSKFADYDPCTNPALPKAFRDFLDSRQPRWETRPRPKPQQHKPVRVPRNRERAYLGRNERHRRRGNPTNQNRNGRYG